MNQSWDDGAFNATVNSFGCGRLFLSVILLMMFVYYKKNKSAIQAQYIILQYSNRGSINIIVIIVNHTHVYGGESKNFIGFSTGV